MVAEGREGIEEMRTLVANHPRFDAVIGERGRYRLVDNDDAEGDEVAPYYPSDAPTRLVSVR